MGKRKMVLVLLPEGADDGEAFANMPEGALFAADMIDPDGLADRDTVELTARSQGIAMWRAVMAGRD